MYNQIKSYISPEDFTDDLYKRAAGLLFAQFEENKVNPGMIINQFQDEEEQREIAGLFNARLEMVETKDDKLKAIKETIYKVKKNSFEKREASVEATDVTELMKLIEEKKNLSLYKNLNITLGRGV